MSSYDNMSGSEDGQLRSPNDEHYISGDDDTDSLDIKPPQARLSYTSREAATGSGRRKEKKHSKERKHKERRLSGGGGGAVSRSEREHRSSRGESGSERGEHRRNELLEPRRDYRRDERHELERYHQRNERPEQIDRRYAKHGGGGHHPYHYHHQPPPPPAPYGHHHQHHHQPPPPPPMHMPPRSMARHEYYHADYHHNNRHHGGSGQLYDGGGELDMTRDVRRYKYGYEQAKDAESLEQDLRSRLLSKRHKYVKDYELDEHHYERGRDVERKERRSGEDYERERAVAKAERHKLRREKERGNVIEVLDSPEVLAARAETRRKHKLHSNNRERLIEYMDEEPPRRKTPDDPELLARRAKLLAAEREKEKRKEYAREELEARRELLRERIEHNDALSPSAVAASVTAGLNVVVKRKSSIDKAAIKRRKFEKKSKEARSDVEGNGDESEESESDSSHSEDEEDENENGDSSGESGSDSVAQSEASYDGTRAREQKRTKRKRKRGEAVHRNGDDEEEEDVPLPDSPLSIGELYKSPTTTRKHKSKKSHSASTASSRASSRRSSRGSRSRSHSQRSDSVRSRSRSSSERSHNHSEHSDRHRSRSRSVSSGTRSEERGMAATQLDDKTDEIVTPMPAEEEKLLAPDSLNKEQVPCDDNGVPLPNYFPGVQGCRSVEEFQCLNRIEEGTYGVVYRAKDKRTNEIVALKRLKMEKEKEGFPITSLREINTLLKGQHPNIVTVREIVVGSNMDKIFIVMDYVEHDLKSLMETMKTRKQSFFPGEVKCLTQQLLLAVAHLHDNWILHRDLKTSNLLLSHKGILKVGDFGLAREYGSPLKKYTSLVVTLWYRAPELLLCSPEYSTPIDVWSVGCIFAEFLQMLPFVPGKSEVDQLNRIFKELGTPNDKIWPGYTELPAVRNMLSQNSQFAEYPVSQLRKRFIDKTTEMGISLLQGLLTYDPKQRLTADAALKHAYFKELPLPIDPSMFPTWPAKSELGARKANSPKPPSGGSQFKQLGGGDDAAMAGSSAAAGGAGVATGTAATATGGAKLTSGIITGHKKSAAAAAAASAASNTGFVLNSGLTQRQLAMGPGFSLKF